MGHEHAKYLVRIFVFMKTEEKGERALVILNFCFVDLTLIFVVPDIGRPCY